MPIASIIRAPAPGSQRSTEPTQVQLAPGKYTQAMLLDAPERAASTTPGAARAPAERAAAVPAGPRPTLQMIFGPQRVATNAPDEVAAAAGRGTATPATRLPHADQIQRAFGRHDVSGIQAHVGNDAAEAARGMGARAYATGHHVVLGAATDLHTVAHEAAHVVQQRGGVQLKGGVGEHGDAHEQHADAVADRVVQGASAEDLLDRYAPDGAAHASAAAVQRKEFELGDATIDTAKRADAQKVIRAAWTNNEHASVESLVEELDGYLSDLVLENFEEVPEGNDEYDQTLALRNWIANRAEYKAEAKLEQKHEAEQQENQKAAEKKVANAMGQSKQAKAKNKAKKKAANKAAKASADAKKTGRAVLDAMQIGSKCTELGEVSFGGKTYPAHLSLPSFDELYQDTPADRATILASLHITVEQYGADHENNPRLWVRDDSITGQSAMNAKTKNEMAEWARQYRDALDAQLANA